MIAALDPFNAKNGFNPSGSSNYSHEFREKFFRAQAVRMNRLIDRALGKLRAIEGGKYYYNDDDAFVIHQTEGARLAEMDLTIHPGTLKPHKLLKKDGTIVTEVIKSVRIPNPGNAKRAKSFQEGSKSLTVSLFWVRVRFVRSIRWMMSITAPTITLHLAIYKRLPCRY